MKPKSELSPIVKYTFDNQEPIDEFNFEIDIKTNDVEPTINIVEHKPKNNGNKRKRKRKQSDVSTRLF